MTTAADPVEDLLAYVPRLLLGWSPPGSDDRHLRVTGTLVFVDISGFTRLTERLARKGKVGAEEMSDVLSATFAGLLTEASQDGGDLVKWGGDAVLLLFHGPDHAQRAARAAHRMRAALKVIGRVATSSGPVVLRMSVGIHSGDFDFFLVGDPEIHRELLISGPGASITAEIEAAADAGKIGLSAATAELLDRRVLGAPLAGGRLLRLAPEVHHPPEAVQPRRLLEPSGALPPPIRAHLLGGPIQPEHRLITVAFVQFSGTDDLITSEGPLALAEALDDVVRNVQHACADHDVTFFESDINRDGGKIMLTAGAPRSADHDEERMLRVARIVLDRAGRLPLRIGINRGHVFAGDFGPTFRRTFSVKGDAINLAARVMGKALPGRALATREVVTRSQTVFRTTQLPPFMVKGKSLPVRAMDVGALVGARAEERAVLTLVGRTDEMALLTRALADVRAGRGRLVDIVGAAGIGKSRLVSEMLSEVEDIGVAHALCEQYESSTAYAALGRLLREVLGISPTVDATGVADILTGRVAERVPDLLRWLPLIGIAMDVELPATRETQELDEGFLAARLADVVIDLLAVFLEHPTVILVEDAQVMDDSSARVLTQLVAQLDRRPWLVVVTRRDDATGFVPDHGSGVLSIRPQPLDHAEGMRFVQAALDEHPLPRQALVDLVERGGGNPMFLEALALDAGRTGKVADLPESVEGLITSQIDRLHPADRTVLRYAAVLGTVVDEDAVAVLLEDDGAPLERGALDRLVDFLVRDRSGGTRFRNVLIRDVAYGGLPYRQRKVLHARVGHAIEGSTSAPEDHCELLSMHFFHADEHDKAWHYSVLAGESALAKYALGEAIEFFGRATQSTPHGTTIDATELARVYERLADTRWLVGLPQEAAEAYALARKHLGGDPVALAGIIEKEARIDQRHRKHSQAMRRISRGLHQLDGITGASGEMARSLLARRYADSLFSQRRVDEALQWADLAARAAEESLDKDTLAKAYEVLNYIHAGSGREEPFPYGLMALQAYTELGNLRHQGWCLNNLAMQDFAAGRWGESLGKFRRASDLFRRIGDTAAEGNAAYNEAEILVRQGRYADAGALLPDVLLIARAVEDEELVALAQRETARVLAGSGEVDQSVTLAREARDRFDQLGESSEVAATDLALAEILQGAGRWSEAAGVLDALGEDPGPSATRLRLLGRQSREFGRPGEARELFTTALAAAEQEGDRLEQGLVLHELAELAPERPDPQLARKSAEILDPIGVVRPG